MNKKLINSEFEAIWIAIMNREEDYPFMNFLPTPTSTSLGIS
jgi:hypothetical protein